MSHDERNIEDNRDPIRERACWSKSFSGRDHVRRDASVDDHGPASGDGVDARARDPGRGFDDVESGLSRGWDAGRRSSSLGWDRARLAARGAWNRITPSS
jgi:hypothetical protein